jgi:glycosyltransferase involved in cell wall biosynthesis
MITYNGPLVSVLMNCFNGEEYLREAIDSVISQTYENWEIIFWDNRSTDKSKEIFDSYKDERLKYYCASEHTDLGNGRANAFKYLDGEYIAVLDVDDVWLPKKLEKQVPMFSDPEVGIVISDTSFFNKTKERTLYNGSYPPEGRVFRTLLVDYFVSLETLVLRKSFIKKLDYNFDSDFSFVSDFDIVLRVSEISKLSICKEVLAKWRVHDKSDSWQSPVTFFLEKKRWIEKQINRDPSFYNKYENEINQLNKKNIRSMSLSYIIMKNRLLALKSIKTNRPYCLNDYKILFLCFLPFSNYILTFLQKRKVLG